MIFPDNLNVINGFTHNTTTGDRNMSYLESSRFIDTCNYINPVTLDDSRINYRYTNNTIHDTITKVLEECSYFIESSMTPNEIRYILPPQEIKYVFVNNEETPVYEVDMNLFEEIIGGNNG